MKRVLSILLSVSILMAMLVSCTSDDYYVRPVKKQREVQTTKEVIDPMMRSMYNVKKESSIEAKEAFAQFNLKLLNALNQKNSNLFFSAMSINSALTMAYFGANGTTREEMQKVLSYNDMTLEQIASAQRAILESYKDTGDTIFNVANSIWVDDECTVKDSYVQTMGDVFDTSVDNLDLQSTKAIDTINSWVKEKTNDMIPELVKKEANPFESTLLVLLNAIYFNGTWSEPFDGIDTFDREFEGATSKGIVQMMSSEKKVLGYDGRNYKAIALPYGNDKRFYMIVVLPDDDIEEFIASQNGESWYNVLTTFEQKEDAIYQIPKFDMEITTNLNDTLKSLGMNTAFENSADLSNMSQDELFISTVLHKAKIMVNEQGTEAAAVTEVACDGAAMEVPNYGFEFYAHKPFLFFIVDSEEEMVLFTGKYCDIS